MNVAAIQVRGLVKRFDALAAVDGIDFEVAPGECVGLLGPNGAGKTTTVEIVEGLQQPTAGEVQVLGLNWAQHASQLRQRIGVGLQETRFYDRLTVLETLQLFHSLYAKPRALPDALAMVQLEEKAKTQVRNLSGGQRQRLALAVALIGDPELLFLDEPTTGLDPQSRRALWDVLETLRGKGRTVVLTTHYMEEAATLCDRVIIVDHGKIVAAGTPAELIARLGAGHRVEVVTEPRLAIDALRALPGVAEVRELKDRVELGVNELHVTLPALTEAVARAGVKLMHLASRQATLDDVFLHLTGRKLREEDA